MADRPILFSAPMIRALLDGRKMQTRRVLKPAPFIDPMGNFCAPDRKGKIWNWGQHTDGRPCTRNYEKKHIRFVTGDRLWVRETWKPKTAHSCGESGCECDDVYVYYPADQQRLFFASSLIPEEWTMPETVARGGLASPIHMPRWASRLTLTVTDVRVERLQEISEADAEAEGAERLTMDDDGKFYQHDAGTFRTGFAGLWEHLNGPRGFGWDANPWVVAVSFEVHRCNIDQMGAA